jgi:polyhydroxyalkanoate synthesis regulator phasin
MTLDELFTQFSNDIHDLKERVEELEEKCEELEQKGRD